ncbi:MAG: hypothetical protein A3F18_07435 [Legionellales bacterium RIFCSPHIGHO2_12_FULL_37_14]|nr:MAG: hypothetical protein A3F18_07435 [Legionellales bacterium RIFCSPHIGHO2_12_FULL_37_14]
MQIELSKSTLDEAKELALGASLSLEKLLELIKDVNTAESLRILLLHDLLTSFESLSTSKIMPEQKAKSKRHKRLFWYTLGAGLLNVICDGFGSMSVLLTTFVDVATAGMALLWASVGFALLYGGLFVLFQLCSQYKGSIFNSSYDLNHYVQEHSLLNALAQFMDTRSFLQMARKSVLTKAEIKALKDCLLDRDNYLMAHAQELEAKRRGKWVKFTQNAFTVIFSTWTFTYGFMFGFFTLAMVMTLLPAVIIPVWGCLILGTVTGLAALSVYWLNGQSKIDRAIESFANLDKKSIDVLLKPIALNAKSLEDKNSVDLIVKEEPASVNAAQQTFFFRKELTLGASSPLRRCRSADDIACKA